MAKCGSCGQEMPDSDSVLASDFEYIWDKLWPGLKHGRLQAWRAYRRLPKSKREAIVKDLQIRGPLVTDKQHFPRFATYINGERWNDELPAQTISDPPKPAQPDGGMARREFCPASTLIGGGPAFTPKSREVAAEYARQQFAEILKSVKVKQI